MIVVRVKQRDYVAGREFHVQAVVDHPAIWKPAGDENYSWGQALRDGPETPGDVETGAFFSFADPTCGGVSRHGILCRPPNHGCAGYTYGTFGPILLPYESCEFRTFIGLRDGCALADGVLVSVIAIDENGKEHVLVNHSCGTAEWKAVSADLSAFKGKPIRLKLVADSGPAGSSSGSWASWGEPRIVLGDAHMRIEVGQ